MLSLISFINRFKKNLVSAGSDDQCKKFFFKSNMHLIVSLEIASSTILNQELNYLILKKSIPSSFGNEREIEKVLKEGIEKKFYIKKKNSKKNKKPHFKISRKFSLMITDWYLNNKSEFN